MAIESRGQVERSERFGEMCSSASRSLRLRLPNSCRFSALSPCLQTPKERVRRFRPHYTPTTSSCLNLVVRWFREIREKRIRRGSFHGSTTTGSPSRSSGLPASKRPLRRSVVVKLFWKHYTSLAALAIEHGAGLCSSDIDFARFSGSAGGTPWLDKIKPVVAGARLARIARQPPPEA